MESGDFDPSPFKYSSIARSSSAALLRVRFALRKICSSMYVCGLNNRLADVLEVIGGIKLELKLPDRFENKLGTLYQSIVQLDQ